MRLSKTLGESSPESVRGVDGVSEWVHDERTELTKLLDNRINIV